MLLKRVLLMCLVAIGLSAPAARALDEDGSRHIAARQRLIYELNQNGTPSGHGNITISLYFTDDQRSRLIHALERIRTNPVEFYLPSGVLIRPYNHILALVTNIRLGDGRPNAIGYSTQDGRIYINPVAFDHPIEPHLMSLLLHEADHRRYGGHSCPDGVRDADDNGPFGVSIYYLLRLRNSNSDLQPFESQWAASAAMSNASHLICCSAQCITPDGLTKTEGYRRVEAAYQSNIFPSAPPPPPEPPESGGCVWNEGYLICY